VHNSSRAQQAAEAGVEDALARIKFYQASNCTYTESNGAPTCGGAQVSSNSCPSTGNTDSLWQFTENSGEACWIHRNISNNGNNLSGSLVADTGNYTQPSTAQINLGSNTRAIILNWGSSPGTNCSQSSPWPNNTDGALELTMISYDNAGNVATPLKGLLFPRMTSPGVPCTPVGNPNPYADLISPGGSVSQCPNTYALSGYKFCTQIQFDPTKTTADPNAYLRLRARFAGDTYNIVALTAKCTTLPCSPATLPTNSLTIDVTGQSGSVYRRIIAQSTVTNPQIYSIFDFVLFSEGDLNKSYACINAAPSANCS
jgi:Tfp pilus assembly protein PilX